MAEREKALFESLEAERDRLRREFRLCGRLRARIGR